MAVREPPETRALLEAPLHDKSRRPDFWDSLTGAPLAGYVTSLNTHGYEQLAQQMTPHALTFEGTFSLFRIPFN